jgi:hypothetical protein
MDPPAQRNEIPIERTGDDSRMSGTLAVQCKKVLPIVRQHSARFGDCELEDLRVAHLLICSTSFRNREHIVPKPS